MCSLKCATLLCLVNLVLTGELREIRPIEEVVRERGYPLDVVSVTTEDGYILTVHRMRHGYQGEGTNKVPVLLQHGLLETSVAYMASTTCLAYHLADKGFDVWMGNNRGNIYSKGHKKYNYKRDRKFWNYSFHEMGVYDLPAIFKEIIKQTGVEKINYIGMSMGTTQFLVIGAEDSSNLEMVDSIILMAPVARPMKLFSKKRSYYPLKYLMGTFGIFGSTEVFNPSQNLIKNVLMMTISRKEWVVRLCERIVRREMVKKQDNVDFETLREDFKYFARGATTKIYQHYMQIAKSGIFRQFDYRRKNKIHYKGRTTPPVYNLKNLTPKIYLLAGGNDVFAPIEEVKWLKDQLPDAELISDKLNDFVHKSFTFGRNLKDTLYLIIDDILEKKTYDLEEFIDQ